jgi:HEAT repeat protein
MAYLAGFEFIKRGITMKSATTKKLSSMIFIIITLLVLPGLAQQMPKDQGQKEAVNMSEISTLLDSIYSYEYGQSRENITMLTDLLREALKSDDLREEIEEEFIDFLESDASLPAKQFISERLSLFATDESVSILVNMLDNPQTVDMALFALERIPAEDVDEELCDALDDAKGRIKVAIVTAIGSRGKRECISDIISLLNDSDSTIVSAALAALGQIGGKQAAKALKKFIEQEKYLLQATDAYLQCAEHFMSQGQPYAAAAIFKEIYQSNESAHMRYASLRGMIKSSDENSTGIILKILRSNQKEMHNIAIQLVAEIPPSSDIGDIARFLPQLQAEEQVQLLAALAGRKESSAREVMISSVESDNDEVRIAALKALGINGDAGVVPILAAAAASGSGTEREVAREALYRLNAREVEDFIIRLLPQSDSSIKVEYIRALAARHVPDAEEILFNTVADTNLNVRLEAIKALKELGSAQYMEKAVESHIAAKTLQERKEWEKTMVAIASRFPQGASPATGILSKLDQVEETNTKGSLIEVLGEIGDATGLSTLKKLLDDKNDEIKAAAIRGLSLWPDATPGDDLLRIAKSSRNNQHRVLALRGYVNLIPLTEVKSAEERVKMYQVAMELASNSNEKRMVLSGLSTINEIDALKFSVDYLQNEELNQEAVAAILKIAQKLDEKYSGDIIPIIYKARDVALNETIKTEYSELLYDLESFDDHITLWQFAGPFEQQGVSLFEFQFAPETFGKVEVDWKIFPQTSDKERAWYLALDKVLGPVESVVYLRTKVWSDKEHKAILEMGSNDAIKAWLNQSLIHSNDVLRTITPGEDRVNVQLKRGWNSLMLKVVNAGGSWGACARFRNSEGEHISGMKVSLDEFMGDWQGSKTLPDQSEDMIVAQVIAYQHGKYTANLLNQFDTREESLVVLNGRRKEDKIQFAEVKNKGISWQGMIAGDEFSGMFKGEKEGTFTMKMVLRTSPNLGKKPPDNAIVLFSGNDLDNWEQRRDRTGYINLARYMSCKDCAAYLRTEILSEIKQEAVLKVGSDDAVKAWLNGNQILAHNIMRGAEPAQEKINVTLNKGWNIILLKITNGGGGWGAFVRLVDSKGRPLENIAERDPQKSSASTKEVLRQNDHFLTNWHVAGPYQKEGMEAKAIFDIPFAPEKSAKGIIKWKAIDMLNVDYSAKWGLNNEMMEVLPGSGDLVSKQKFTDFKLHIEFRSPFMAAVTGQKRGNSGIYLQGRYEVQVLDSYGLEGKDNECGGIYKVAYPDINMCAPPMQWQTYDITFEAPRFNSKGSKIKNARLTVDHNGKLIHNNLELPQPTAGAIDNHIAEPGCIMLQDHGDLVQYRNIWLMETTAVTENP